MLRHSICSDWEFAGGVADNDEHTPEYVHTQMIHIEIHTHTQTHFKPPQLTTFTQIQHKIGTDKVNLSVHVIKTFTEYLCSRFMK